MSFACSLCDNTYTRKYNLDAHMHSHARTRPFACTVPACTAAFARRNDLTRHTSTVHERRVTGTCADCGAVFVRGDAFRRHVRAAATGRGCRADSE
ncbi:hypothetical protein BC831DRAFT_401226 [Entophlyctis helioformis]|nr:hypothetical protein BC831DRAFT_405289 [Entophlyctis helioformis]KAI8925418.1 hypothetical protein BC831DRAFT_401226 [Entophlyctis helioformis]